MHVHAPPGRGRHPSGTAGTRNHAPSTFVTCHGCWIRASPKRTMHTPPASHANNRKAPLGQGVATSRPPANPSPAEVLEMMARPSGTVCAPLCSRGRRTVSSHVGNARHVLRWGSTVVAAIHAAWAIASASSGAVSQPSPHGSASAAAPAVAMTAPNGSARELSVASGCKAWVVVGGYGPHRLPASRLLRCATDGAGARSRG